MRKIKVLIIVGHYLPGFNSGGILRSVINTVDHLSDEFEFYVLTRNHDLGVSQPYKNSDINDWQKVGNAKVYYLDRKAMSYNNIYKLINANSFDCIHLNSFFDMLSIKVNFAMQSGKIKQKPLLLSPRGEFAEASFNIKFFKKFLFVKLVKFLGLYSQCHWHVSSQFELLDLNRIMRIKNPTINIVKDLPIYVNTSNSNFDRSCFKENTLRIIFLSRISLEKNLDVAIKILSHISSSIIFDIYGTIENKKYWNKCMKMIGSLPKNIKVKYIGIVSSDDVINVFSRYDLFLFPTGGENYGHVIAESISAGTKVLISKNTPWQNLEADKLGWSFELDDLDSFVDVINEMSKQSISERINEKMHVIKGASARLSNPALIGENRLMYRNLSSIF